MKGLKITTKEPDGVKFPVVQLVKYHTTRAQTGKLLTGNRGQLPLLRLCVMYIEVQKVLKWQPDIECYPRLGVGVRHVISVLYPRIPTIGSKRKVQPIVA